MTKDEQSMLDVLNQLDITANDITTIMCHFHNLIEAGDSPDYHFDYIDSGCYKEVYWLGDAMGKYVIKFSQDEDLGKVQVALTRAKMRGLGKVFLPFYYFSLEYPVPASDEFLDRNSDFLELDDTHSTIVIQPIIADTCLEVGEDDCFCTWSREDYLRDPLKSPRGIVEYDLLSKSPIDTKAWLTVFVNVFGEDKFSDLLEFCQVNRIEDLHTGNIGYDKEGNPVIIDFAVCG